MIEKFLKIIFIVLGILVLGNLVFLDFVFVKQKKPELTNPAAILTSTLTPAPKPTTGNSVSECGQDCLTTIKQEVKKAVDEISITQTTGTEGTVIPSPTPIRAKNPSFLYLPIGSSGSTSSTSWIDIPGTEFYFDLVDYSGLKAVRWEINLRSFLAGNNVSSRIYDVSNSRAVDGSELSTTSGISVLLRSGDLTIWRGNNLYRIQAKSESGNPVYLDAPRLKITLEK